MNSGDLVNHSAPPPPRKNTHIGTQKLSKSPHADVPKSGYLIKEAAIPLMDRSTLWVGGWAAFLTCCNN